MSEFKKANTDLAYFLTFTIVGSIDFFTRKDHAVAIYLCVLVDFILHQRTLKQKKVQAYA
jgi:hypothetical protein